jgi:hypothetical protein
MFKIHESFSIILQFNDTETQELVCAPCLDLLNTFYHVKNHVQRSHTIFFRFTQQKIQPAPSNIANMSSSSIPNVERDIFPLKRTRSTIENGMTATIEETDLTLPNLKRTKSTIAHVRSHQVRHADNQPSTSRQQVDCKQQINLEGLQPAAKGQAVSGNGVASTSQSIMKDVEIKQERIDTPPVIILPPVVLQTLLTQRRGKQRGEVGRLIYKDDTTNR